MRRINAPDTPPTMISTRTTLPMIMLLVWSLLATNSKGMAVGVPGKTVGVRAIDNVGAGGKNRWAIGSLHMMTTRKNNNTHPIRMV